MSIFASGMGHRSFLGPITAVCFMLGLILAAAWHTATQISRDGRGVNRAGFVFSEGVQVAVDKASKDASEITTLTARVRELEDKRSKGSSATSILNSELQQNRDFAGLTDVTGPGVQVTLIDSKRTDIQPSDSFFQNNLIHDGDVGLVINELKAAGAEAISVNGQRIIATSSVRCVGPVVLVNNVPAAPPYVISAIGDPDAMYGGLNTPNGVLDKLRLWDPAMAKCEKSKLLKLPAFVGGTQLRFARPVKTKSETKSQNDSGSDKSDSSDKDNSKSKDSSSDKDKNQ